MSYKLPTFRHPDLPENELGFTKADYEGSLSTLCAGCGHDSISGSLVRAVHELSIEPHRIVKLSDIGMHAAPSDGYDRRRSRSQRIPS